MSQPYIGEIRIFGGNFAPQDWQFCAGQTLPISQYAVLFTLIGTTYGGNGTTTFNLPDLRGRFPIHQGTGIGLSTYIMGQQGGSESITLTQANMPSHNHLVAADNGAPSTPTRTPASNTYLAATLRNEAPIYTSAVPNIAMGPLAVGHAGFGALVAIGQPCLGVSFIIAMFGVFPSRN
jgi:microcystin-dependent protein